MPTYVPWSLPVHVVDLQNFFLIPGLAAAGSFLVRVKETEKEKHEKQPMTLMHLRLNWFQKLFVIQSVKQGSVHTVCRFVCHVFFLTYEHSLVLLSAECVSLCLICLYGPICPPPALPTVERKPCFPCLCVTKCQQLLGAVLTLGPSPLQQYK